MPSCRVLGRAAFQKPGDSTGNEEGTMAKLWEGRTSGETADLADRLNASISFDNRMAKQDITGSIAHAAMLKKQGIISEKEALKLFSGDVRLSLIPLKTRLF